MVNRCAHLMSIEEWFQNRNFIRDADRLWENRMLAEYWVERNLRGDERIALRHLETVRESGATKVHETIEYLTDMEEIGFFLDAMNGVSRSFIGTF